jgi:hypothetical protein
VYPWEYFEIKLIDVLNKNKISRVLETPQWSDSSNEFVGIDLYPIELCMSYCTESKKIWASKCILYDDSISDMISIKHK